MHQLHLRRVVAGQDGDRRAGEGHPLQLRPAGSGTQVLVNGATSCVAGSGDCVRYDYDNEGNLVRRDDTLGATEFTYDRLNRQRSVKNNDTSGPVTEVLYDYNDDGKLTLLTQVESGQVVDKVQYTYDDGNKVLTAIGNPGSANPLRIDFQHDADGRANYVKFPTLPTNVQVDRDFTNTGRPLWIHVRRVSGGGTLADTDYSYRQGTKDTNQLQKIQVSGSDNANLNSTVTYDYKHNNLWQANRSDGADRTYDYDPAGNLASEKVVTASGSSTTTHYGYDLAG